MNPPIAPALAELERAIAASKAKQEEAKRDLAAAIDKARAANHTWSEISYVFGSDVRQYASNLRASLPDPE